MSDDRKAFVLRVAPGGEAGIEEALATHELFVGWSLAEGLLDPALDWWAFRQVIHDIYHHGEEGYRRSGRAASAVWLFLREMSRGDYVVVPHRDGFHVAEVVGDARFDADRVEGDRAYRRPVRWLHQEAILRSRARAALQSRMKVRGTAAYAEDLVDEIEDCLAALDAGDQDVTFESDLRGRLVDHTLEEMRSGRVDSYKFERIVRAVLLGLGATRVDIVARSNDMGADLIAYYVLAGAFEASVAVQVKHYQAEPRIGHGPVEEALRGQDHESADYAMVVTSGLFDQDAEDLAGERGVQLVDGPHLAALIIDQGLTGAITGDGAP